MVKKKAFLKTGTYLSAAEVSITLFSSGVRGVFLRDFKMESITSLKALLTVVFMDFIFQVIRRKDYRRFSFIKKGF